MHINDLKTPRRVPQWMAAVAAVALLGGGVVAARSLASGHASAASLAFPVPAPPVATATQAAAPVAPATIVSSYADIVSRVAPAVVTIRADQRVRPAVAFPDSDDPLFRQLLPRGFAPAQPQAQRQEALGSGVIIRSDGYILTNDHVIDGADSIKVDLSDRREFKARVVGSDKPSDLAVLKIDATGLEALPLADSNHVRVGDVVLAIGDPLGVGRTVTMGIISAKGRVTSLGDGSYEDFLQTDAPINRGNSGGPLVNTRGEVVGINSQILSPSGGSVGIGFAIPSNMARNVMTQLIDTGHVRRGLLGVTVQGVTADLASSLGLPAVQGAIVDKVEPDSAGAQAGLEQGDVITSFNGRPVTDGNELRNAVAGTLPGTQVSIGYVRDGKTHTASATLKALDGNGGTKATRSADAGGGNAGLTVTPLDGRQASRLGLPAGSRGVVVQDVDPSGPAADAGIRPGDVIQQVNRQAVNTPGELREALKRSGNRPSLLLVQRDGTPFFVTVG
ncbi:MAG: DegQ family serine endoprotease [Acidobacteriota bacterium]|nr:DegQ family serine endoprotease [Acidobacteriota bacterium]